MKRIFVIGIISTLCLIVSGCSHSTQFFVINKSLSPIEVEYIVTSDFDPVEDTQVKPYKMSLFEWDTWLGNKELREVPLSEYEFDAKLHKVKVKLNPNEVLRVAIALHHESVLPTADYKFPITSLSLIQDKDQIFYIGKRFYQQFEKKDDNNYFIAYK